MRQERESVKRERYFFSFSFFVSLYDLRKSDFKFLSEQKAKLIYAFQATREYQNLSVLSNSKR